MTKKVSDSDLEPYVVETRHSRGRIVVGNSLTSFDDGEWVNDVLLGASFAGEPTGAIPLRRGARGWIAHEGGPGKDEAGIAGLPLSDRFGVPAAAVATMQARLSDGDSLLSGEISRVNNAAKALGVVPGVTGLQAARIMLEKGLDQKPVDLGSLVDEETTIVHENKAGGRIFSCWSFSRVADTTSQDVFCVASHGARLMALYALRIQPKGLICNDAGFGLDDLGIEGLAMLDPDGIAAATVSTNSARIGDPLSTYTDGVLSAVNQSATALGLEIGMSARDAAHRMLEA